MDDETTPAPPAGEPTGDYADQAQRLQMSAEQEAIAAELARLRRINEEQRQGRRA